MTRPLLLRCVLTSAGTATLLLCFWRASVWGAHVSAASSSALPPRLGLGAQLLLLARGFWEGFGVGAGAGVVLGGLSLRGAGRGIQLQPAPSLPSESTGTRGLMTRPLLLHI